MAIGTEVLFIAGFGPIDRNIAESRELVAQTINDLRNLSKSMSFEHIAQLGLVKTIEIESGRINNSGIISTELLIKGEPYPLGEERELVLFRIFQEALNNTLKHSGAKRLKINLQYSEQLFNLTLEDDGAGFLPHFTDVASAGLGLKNMQSRAALIGAIAEINSSPGNGCTLAPVPPNRHSEEYVSRTCPRFRQPRSVRGVHRDRLARGDLGPIPIGQGSRYQRADAARP